jgi:hypothetical protein
MEVTIIKELAPRIGSVIALLALFTAHTTPAAFIIEANGALGAGNYAYTGPGGTAASLSSTSIGNLPAVGDGTFFTLNHVFGGNGTTDEYTFTYSPAANGNNTTFAAGTIFNSLGAAPDLVSSGLTGGTAGIYNVYRIAPANPGISGGNTTYQLSVNGDLKVSQSIDQNAANLATGENIGRWELLGSVNLLNNTDTVTVTMTPDASTYVSMRASGIMFEPIPEPSVVAMLGIGFILLWVRRRLMR